MTNFEATVFIVIMATLLAFIAWLLWQAGRGMVRYYRDNRPRRMATRVTDKPDQRAKRDFDSIDMTRRMISRD